MILPNSVKEAMNILQNAGHECFAVGGCVRDYVMGRTPGDYDLTTNALPTEIIACFEGYRIIETGLKHGTVTVVIEGNNVEITTYRIDGEYKDNRHPENVRFTPLLSEDLARRDFTVNAMAYCEKSGLVDLFGGRADAENKIIRCVGEPDLRFNEDGLRILRALRFASVLGFGIDDETSKSIFRNKNLLKNISKERIFSELNKLICGVGAESVIKKYSEVFEICIGEKVNPEGLNSVCTSADCRYAVILRDCKDVKSVMRSLRADNKTCDFAAKVCPRLTCEFNCDADVKRLIRDIGIKSAELFGEVIKAVWDKDRVFDFNNRLISVKNDCCTVKQLDINGDDMKKLGLSGPDVGRVLNSVLDAVIDGCLENNKSKLLDFVKTMLDN